MPTSSRVRLQSPQRTLFFNRACGTLRRSAWSQPPKRLAKQAKLFSSGV
jgi:hypothetical protein